MGNLIHTKHIESKRLEKNNKQPTQQHFVNKDRQVEYREKHYWTYEEKEAVVDHDRPRSEGTQLIK